METDQPKGPEALAAFVEAMFLEVADPVLAQQSHDYMRGQFPFLGIRAKQRQAITKEAIKDCKLNSIEEVGATINIFWKKEPRDFHYAAIQVLAAYHKLWQPATLQLMESALLFNSWWDTVDYLNADCLGPFFRKFPELIPRTTQWNQSDNIWLQRSSVIFQNKYKRKADLELLARHIVHLSGSKEFFVQKGIGWALRDQSGVNPVWVRLFVADHTLPALSRREALRKIGG